MQEELGDWLARKYGGRGPINGPAELGRELRRRGFDISDASVSRWAKDRKPNPRFCRALADIFREEPEYVLRLAGHGDVIDAMRDEVAKENPELDRARQLASLLASRIQDWTDRDFAELDLSMDVIEERRARRDQEQMNEQGSQNPRE